MADPTSPPRPLRIAMISHYLPSGSKIGVGHQVHVLANAMVRRGHDVTVFSACGESDGALYRTVTVELPARLRTFAFAWRLRDVDLSGYDVLHAHGDDHWLRRGRRRPLAHVRTMHGSCFDEALRIRGVGARLRMLALGVGEVASTVVADRTALVSPGTRRWYPWVRTVVPNGVDRAVFTPRGPADRASVPTILFVGTYQRRKRGRLVMAAFAEVVRPALPDARLVMVCDDAPPAAGVEVTGRIDTDRLAALYRSAWVFCLPSSYEGFGIPYAEAMSSGVSVVATPNPGSRYVTRDGADGVLCDTSELGDVLLRLLVDDGERTSLERRALARAEDFDLDLVCSAYEEIYADASRPRAQR